MHVGEEGLSGIFMRVSPEGKEVLKTRRSEMFSCYLSERGDENLRHVGVPDCRDVGGGRRIRWEAPVRRTWLLADMIRTTINPAPCCLPSSRIVS